LEDCAKKLGERIIVAALALKQNPTEAVRHVYPRHLQTTSNHSEKAKDFLTQLGEGKTIEGAGALQQAVTKLITRAGEDPNSNDFQPFFKTSTKKTPPKAPSAKAATPPISTTDGTVEKFKRQGGFFT